MSFESDAARVAAYRTPRNGSTSGMRARTVLHSPGARKHPRGSGRTGIRERRLDVAPRDRTLSEEGGAPAADRYDSARSPARRRAAVDDGVDAGDERRGQRRRGGDRILAREVGARRHERSSGCTGEVTSDRRARDPDRDRATVAQERGVEARGGGQDERERSRPEPRGERAGGRIVERGDGRDLGHVGTD